MSGPSGGPLELDRARLDAATGAPRRMGIGAVGETESRSISASNLRIRSSRVCICSSLDRNAVYNCSNFGSRAALSR